MSKVLTWNQYADDLPIPDEWENASYGNDACPSFTYKGYQIFHDHPDPRKREIEGSERFCVFLACEYGNATWAVETDDFQEVLDVIKTPYGKRMKFEVTQVSQDPVILTLDDMLNSDEWDFDELNKNVLSGNFIEYLAYLSNNQIYDYETEAGTISFKKLPQS